MKHKRFINILLFFLIILYIATLVCCTDDGRINTHSTPEATEAEPN